jgi:integrase/recombinase XerD
MKKTVEELITEVLQVLERRGNSQYGIDNYRYFWNSMARYFDSVGCHEFNLDVAQEYLASRDAEQYEKRYRSFMRRGILMLDSYQRFGIILNRYYATAHLLENKAYNELLNHYATHLAEFNYSASTIDNYLAHSATFLSYLEKSGLHDIMHMEAAHVLGYISTLQEYSTVTIKHTLGAVRLFLRYLYRNEYIPHDLSDKIGRVNQTEHHKLPSFWTKDEVFALLNAIDRNNPSEKRDYAMVLMVARLGIRSGDLKKLKFINLKWSSNTIEFVQSKTGVPISLPLLRDVGWAIIDYVESARPKIDSPFVFLTHNAPYGPLSEKNHLYKTIEKYMTRARLPIVQKRRNGMHSLRHSLATTLLQDNASLHMISDILGHTSSNSTAIYLQTDIERLRDCALSLGEDGE